MQPFPDAFPRGGPWAAIAMGLDWLVGFGESVLRTSRWSF